MRVFYLFWFFFCAGWGYLSATFPEDQSPSFVHAIFTLPAAFAMSTLLLWLELRRMPTGRLASPPSLVLKPWNRPRGQMLFIGLSFMFTGIWGATLARTADLSSLRMALQLFSIGAGCAGGCFFAHRLFPKKFSAQPGATADGLQPPLS